VSQRRSYDILKYHITLLFLLVNQGATNILQAARASGDTAYSPTSAITLYIDEARNNNAAGQLIIPLSTALLDDVSKISRDTSSVRKELIHGNSDNEAI
jgi:hypothetical protein